MEIDAPPSSENPKDLDNWLYKLWLKVQDDHLKGSTTWDPGNIASGADEHTTVTVNGAALGDQVVVSFSLDITEDMQLLGYVTSANTVTVHLENHGVGAVNLDEGTVYARVFKKVT